MGTSAGHDVFLCFAGPDRDRVRELAAALRAEGLAVFLDELTAPVFDSISAEIERGLLRSSRVLLAYYSHRLPDRPAAQLELTAAFLAGQREGDPTRRIVVVNPEDPDTGHLLPTELADARYAVLPATGGDLRALARRVRDRTARLRRECRQSGGSGRGIARRVRGFGGVRDVRPRRARHAVAAGRCGRPRRGRRGPAGRVVAHHEGLRRGRFTTGATGWLRTAGSGGGLGARLSAVPVDDGGNVIVYLGDKPFVGCGDRLRTWPITTPLRAASPGNGSGAFGGPVPSFAVSDLYEHLGARLAELRRSAPALSPSHRLRDLGETGTVVVPADSLMLNFGHPAANLVLGRPDWRPALRMEPARIREFVEHPLEWMRYYRVFQVEAWNRDLIVTLFVHIGADRDFLYFEFTPCVLAPVKSRYRVIDALSEGKYGAALLDAVGSAVTLPVSIFSRLAWAFRPTRAPGSHGSDYNALRYGARYSIRELAAEDDLADYLKTQDFARYYLVLQEKVFEATVEFMIARGISPQRFVEQARTIQNSYHDNRGANLVGSISGGTNTFTTGQPPGGTGQPGTTG